MKIQEAILRAMAKKIPLGQAAEIIGINGRCLAGMLRQPSSSGIGAGKARWKKRWWRCILTGRGCDESKTSPRRCGVRESARAR